MITVANVAGGGEDAEALVWSTVSDAAASQLHTVGLRFRSKK